MVKRLAPEETDKDGRRIGYMTPEAFEEAGQVALGWGWQTRLCVGTGWATSSVTRYLNGKYPIPKHVAALMDLLVRIRTGNMTIPEEFLPPVHAAEYHPKSVQAPAKAAKPGSKGSAPATAEA